MTAARTFSEIRLVNGSAGDPLLFIDYPGKNNAFLFDAGENGSLDANRLGDLEAVFLTHHHIDHFVGFDRILRANLDSAKTLRVFGPSGTIDRIYARVKSYDYPFFPFQKLVLEVHDILPSCLRFARLDCCQKFPVPVPEDRSRQGPVVYENEEMQIEAVPADHTVPCLAFALAEKTGYHPDPAKLQRGLLRPGNWVGEALRLLRGGQSAEHRLEIQGGRFRLGDLAEQYFAVSRGARVAYVTDTAFSEAVRLALVQLARGAWRLYCDSFYAQAQAKQAATYRHMTTADAANLARLARVEQLVLIHFAGRYAGRYDALVDEARAIFPRVTAEL